MPSWKREFDSKYRKLLNSGSVSAIDKANEVLLKAIAGLDRIQRTITARKSPYNIKRLKR